MAAQLVAQSAVRRSLPPLAGAPVSSIYARALGSDFGKLHPQVQRRFGFLSADGVYAVGTGTMERLWHGAPFTVPFLYLGAWRRIMLPETGTNVPFTITNYAYRDAFGRETVTWIRSFTLSRRFDAYMIYSESRGRIVDYLGTHQHLAVDIDLAVDERGGLRLRSGAQRFYEGLLGFGFPMGLSGIANVSEWFDDADRRFHIDVRVTNPLLGPLFGYSGTFDVEWRPIGQSGVPKDIKPKREERRE